MIAAAIAIISYSRKEVDRPVSQVLVCQGITKKKIVGFGWVAEHDRCLLLADIFRPPREQLYRDSP